MALGVFALTSCGFGGTTSGGCALMSCGVVGPRPLTVFAAASLQPSFDKIATEVKARYQISPTFNYAGTQTLAAQLTDGAQADVFASADMAHMTTIQNAGLIAGTVPTNGTLKRVRKCGSTSVEAVLQAMTMRSGRWVSISSPMSAPTRATSSASARPL